MYFFILDEDSLVEDKYVHELTKMEYNWEDMRNIVKVEVTLPSMTDNVDVGFTQRSFTVQFSTS